MTDLTLLCVTGDSPKAMPFVDRLAEDAETLRCRLAVVDGSRAGYIEAILDEAVEACKDGYILRIDDDETISVGMLEWLRRSAYHDSEHWAFPRANLWPDAQHKISNRPLWPDLQTRLSVKAKAGGRSGLHDGSPFGTGTVAPCVIEHHKFLVHSRAERETILERYDHIRPGAGASHAMFSLPEIYDPQLKLEAIS